jgi:hypothetical protein
MVSFYFYCQFVIALYFRKSYLYCSKTDPSYKEVFAAERVFGVGLLTLISLVLILLICYWQECSLNKKSEMVDHKIRGQDIGVYSGYSMIKAKQAKCK